MAKFKLTFKKDCGSMREGAKKGDSVIIEKNCGIGGIYMDDIKEAVKIQLGKTIPSPSSDYYTIEKL